MEYPLGIAGFLQWHLRPSVVWPQVHPHSTRPRIFFSLFFVCPLIPSAWVFLLILFLLKSITCFKSQTLQEDLHKPPNQNQSFFVWILKVPVQHMEVMETSGSESLFCRLPAILCHLQNGNNVAFSPIEWFCRLNEGMNTGAIKSKVLKSRIKLCIF